MTNRVITLDELDELPVGTKFRDTFRGEVHGDPDYTDYSDYEKTEEGWEVYDVSENLQAFFQVTKMVSVLEPTPVEIFRQVDEQEPGQHTYEVLEENSEEVAA